MMIALAQALVVALAVPFARTPLQLFVAAVVAGAALGAGHAASRALLTTCIPRGTEAEAFGFYAVCGKLASPTHSLLPALLLPRVGLGPVSLATGLLVLLGFLLVSRLPGGGQPLTSRVACPAVGRQRSTRESPRDAQHRQAAD